MNDIQNIWVYLSANPLLHLTLTLIAYQVGTYVYAYFNYNPLFNPVLLAIIILVAMLWMTGTTYENYFAGAQFVHFLLGPATVALALPIYKQIARVRRSGPALIAALLAGSVTASVTAVGLGWLFGASHDLMTSLAPKSVTTPIAMGITEKLGGLPSLTPAIVLLTGIIGAVFGPLILNALGIKDWAARGLAMGTASHGIGTARALQVNSVAGAFAGLAMGLNALATALLVPLIWRLIWG